MTGRLSRALRKTGPTERTLDVRPCNVHTRDNARAALRVLRVGVDPLGHPKLFSAA